jgi:hypothetical protein
MPLKRVVLVGNSKTFATRGLDLTLFQFPVTDLVWKGPRGWTFILVGVGPLFFTSTPPAFLFCLENQAHPKNNPTKLSKKIGICWQLARKSSVASPLFPGHRSFRAIPQSQNQLEGYDCTYVNPVIDTFVDFAKARQKGNSLKL